MKVGGSLYLGRNLLESRLHLQAYHCLDGDCGDFLPWLRQKARTEISKFLSIGKSTYGRCLIASEFIHPGDTILEVPYSVQLAPDNLPPQICSFLKNDVGDIAKLALVILIEQKLAQDSEWAPYISRLPRIGSMNSTIFWSDDDLEMIRGSYVYHETIKQRAQIEKDYFSIKHALQHVPDIFEDVTLKEFKRAYGLVTSRAWTSTRGVSLIPFADFLNHDDNSATVVLCDESKQISEVVTDCDYTPGDQVLIRYGKFSNGTLLLDFGFALSSNIYDQVQIDVDIPHHDPLYAVKMDMMHKHFTPAVKDDNDFCSCRNSFIIKEIKPTSRKGRGIPQSLRAFARVLCSSSPQELSYLANEAAQTDGRLARQPLKNRTVELQAHEFLLSRINRSIEGYNYAIEPLRTSSYPHMNDKVAQKAQQAQDLLGGELRVLQSAAAWLKNYCKTL